MSEIQQVGPNHWIGPTEMEFTPNFHITQYGVDNYPNGHLIQHEPLNPGNKKIPLVYTVEGAEDMGEFFRLFSAGGHDGYLDMRVQSVHGRGECMGLVILWSIIWLGMKGWGFIDGLAWSDTYVIDLIALVFISLTLAIGLFKPIALPIRFHKNNQEVYVYHNKVLYRIPWQECEMSVIVAKTHIGSGVLKDGYELMMWLNPKHAVNQDLTGQRHQYLSLANCMGSHIGCYGYWEYIRRYMTGDGPFWMEISKEPRQFRPNRKTADGKEQSLLRAWVMFILVLPLGFIARPAKFAIWCNPLRDKWPEEVHEWTGERCNWH